MFEFENFQYFYMFKGTVSVISSDPQCKEDKARFTISVHWGKRSVCVNLSKTDRILLSSAVCKQGAQQEKALCRIMRISP